VDQNAGKQWIAISSEVRASLGATPLEMPWLPIGIKGFTRGLPPSIRMQDAANVGFLAACKKANAEPSDPRIVQGHFIDLNPSVHMKVWGMARGMCTHSLFYSYELERVLEPQEHLQLLGYDAAALNLEHLSEANVKDLAGNAHCLRQATIVLAAMLHSVHFPGLWANR
jgi:hypothetical protein